jgi:hypothetical protein
MGGTTPAIAAKKEGSQRSWNAEQRQAEEEPGAASSDECRRASKHRAQAALRLGGAYAIIPRAKLTFSNVSECPGGVFFLD